MKYIEGQCRLSRKRFANDQGEWSDNGIEGGTEISDLSVLITGDTSLATEIRFRTTAELIENSAFYDWEHRRRDLIDAIAGPLLQGIHQCVTDRQAVSSWAAYLARDSVHRYCRRLLSLPFLPKSAIPEAFQDIKDRAEMVQLKSLIEYVESTWIDSTLWPPAVWLVYRSSVQTNNDRKASTSNLPLYKLIDLLHREAKIVEINMRLMSETKLLRFQRKSTAHIQTKLAKLWTEYEAGTRSTDALLKSYSRIYTIW